jgi:hypothetical protein
LRPWPITEPLLLTIAIPITVAARRTFGALRAGAGLHGPLAWRLATSAIAASVPVSITAAVAVPVRTAISLTTGVRPGRLARCARFALTLPTGVFATLRTAWAPVFLAMTAARTPDVDHRDFGLGRGGRFRRVG